MDEENEDENSDGIENKAMAPSSPLYFYHPDHLGTSTALTDINGVAYQFFLNLPFGETMAEKSQAGLYNTPYKFNGKELDNETGFYYYGARYYDPRISIWASVDPLAEKYRNISPYSYVANNPINFIDPDGRKIVYAKNATKEFKRAFASAIRYLKAHNADGLFAKLQKSDEIYTLKEGLKNTHFNSDTNEIIWDPKNGLETTSGKVMSPAAVLNHEADHAVQGEEHPIIKTIDKLIPDEKYTNNEEKRVIQGSEQRTAKALGEIKEGEVTREDNYGTYKETKSTISNELIIPSTSKTEKKIKNDK